MSKKEVEFLFSTNKVVRVLRTATNEIEIVPLEEYIMGVLAGEMPASFELEALKAQAVASRSYVMYHILKNQERNYDVVDTVTNQVYINDDELKTKWGDHYNEYITKIKNAVKETSYEYITYGGEIAEALFFSTSTGHTENSEDVFVSKVPYLRSVASPWDNISPAFSENNEYPVSDVCRLLGIPQTTTLNISILGTTSTGRIKNIRINDKSFTGSDIASLLGLRSNFFTIKEDKGKIYITTKGYGHGVGMSQYGANGMAKEGHDYIDILKHFYQDTEIKNLNKL
jgi:stage II sporulation protein D